MLADLEDIGKIATQIDFELKTHRPPRIAGDFQVLMDAVANQS